MLTLDEMIDLVLDELKVPGLECPSEFALKAATIKVQELLKGNQVETISIPEIVKMLRDDSDFLEGYLIRLKYEGSNLFEKEPKKIPKLIIQRLYSLMSQRLENYVPFQSLFTEKRKNKFVLRL